jgi:hypothetical protein
LLLGALAMIFYGYVRTTEDLDILVNPERANLDRVAEWLMSMKAMLTRLMACRCRSSTAAR